jgi:hypothetical protein
MQDAKIIKKWAVDVHAIRPIFFFFSVGRNALKETEELAVETAGCY